VKRGEIYLATLAPRSGSEQQGTRPVIVVSHDGFNQAPGWRSVIVVPVSTSSTQAARGPTAVHLPKGVGGLRADSVALCHQITTLDRAKLTKRLGALPEALLADVGEGLKLAQDLTS
jgi:mRNA interferase MazF